MWNVQRNYSGKWTQLKTVNICIVDDLLNVIFYSKIKSCSMSTKSSLKTCLKFFALYNLCVLTQNLWKCPKIFSWDSPALKWSPSLNVSTTPITAMDCRQCLPLSVVQLKGKHWQKLHCRKVVVDKIGQLLIWQYIHLK